MFSNETKIQRNKNDDHLFYKGPSYRTPSLYLEKLLDFLFDCQNDFTKTLKHLKNPLSIGTYLKNFALDLEGQVAIIYDYFYKESPENGIKINRHSLIKIIEAWQQIIENPSSKDYNWYRNIDQYILKRDKQHISLIVQFKDSSELRKTFDYRWQEEPRQKTGDHYIDTLQAFLYEHRWRPDVILHILEKEPKIDFGVNTMYMKVNDPDVTIYNYFDEHPEQHAIKIKKDLLIKLFQAILKTKYAVVEDIILEQTENQIKITVQYEESIPDLHETFPL